MQTPNIRQSLYQCLEHTFTVSDFKQLFLFSVEDAKHCAAIYITIKAANGNEDFIDVTLSNSSHAAVNYASLVKTSQIDRTYSFYFKENAYYLKYSHSSATPFDTNCEITIRKELKYGKFNNLLTSSSEITLSDLPLLTIKEDKTNINNGHYTQADDKTYIDILKGKTVTSSISDFSSIIVNEKGVSEPKISITPSAISFNNSEVLTKTNYSGIAANSTNVSTNINGKAIADIFEANGTTVKNATTSANVTTNIGNHAISNIFETDGTTVKNATTSINVKEIKTNTAADDTIDFNIGSAKYTKTINNVTKAKTSENFNTSRTITIGDSGDIKQTTSNSVADGNYTISALSLKDDCILPKHLGDIVSTAEKTANGITIQLSQAVDGEIVPLITSSLVNEASHSLTADNFKTNKTITLNGHVTGSASGGTSSTQNWNIATKLGNILAKNPTSTSGGFTVKLVQVNSNDDDNKKLSIKLTGSATAGNAESADKLNTDAGSASLPVYFTGGKPAVITNLTLESGVVTATKFLATSDRRLKENIKDFSCSNSILNLPIKEFNYKSNGLYSIGCIAQDLQEICPEIVKEDADGYLHIEETKIVYLLLDETKKLKAKVDSLTDSIELLKKEIEELKKKK